MDERHPSTTPQHPTPDAVPPRQYHVAALVAEGLTNAEIGKRLGIGPGMAESHIDHILRRLGVGTRAQISEWATARGLVRT